jgi:hypothetical protein
MPVRSNVGPSFAAPIAYEAPFNIGKPDMIGPSGGADCASVAAPVIDAINHEAVNARCAQATATKVATGQQLGVQRTK